jgi:hypothetical protein
MLHLKEIPLMVLRLLFVNQLTARRVHFVSHDPVEAQLYPNPYNHYGRHRSQPQLPFGLPTFRSRSPKLPSGRT